jgi:hypothetical protein
MLICICVYCLSGAAATGSDTTEVGSAPYVFCVDYYREVASVTLISHALYKGY